MTTYRRPSSLLSSLLSSWLTSTRRRMVYLPVLTGGVVFAVIRRTWFPDTLISGLVVISLPSLFGCWCSKRRRRSRRASDGSRARTIGGFIFAFASAPWPPFFERGSLKLEKKERLGRLGLRLQDKLRPEVAAGGLARLLEAHLVRVVRLAAVGRELVHEQHVALLHGRVEPRRLFIRRQLRRVDRAPIEGLTVQQKPTISIGVLSFRVAIEPRSRN